MRLANRNVGSFLYKTQNRSSVGIIGYMAKKTKRKPTLKQKRAVDNMVVNGGNVSKAMRDAGYSLETAKSPSKLTDSKAFEELIEEAGLTDEFLLGALKYDIEKKKKNRKQELELAFKVKGRLKDKHEHSGNVNVNLIDYKDA